MKKRIINKIVLNVDYLNLKMNDIMVFSEDKKEQIEALEIVNSGIGKEIK
jgi:hypothetical protein